MSNEIHFGIIEKRKRENPDRSDRPPEFKEWLEYTNHLYKTIPTGVDSIAKYLAGSFSNSLNAWPQIIDAAGRNQLAYRMLKEILMYLRNDGKQDDRTILNNLPDPMITWILDVATGQSVEPKKVGRNSITNLLRDNIIVQMVEAVHDAMKLPYESDERYSACHEVADYLDMKYGSVRTIWRKKRD